jgi:putative MATE family efflux protein
MILGIIAVLSVSLVDTYFVSQLGTDYLAALSFSFPVTMSISSLAIGLGVGAASAVSRAVGANDWEQAKRLSTDSLLLGITVVMVVAVVGYIYVKPLLSVLGATGDVLELGARYMQIWFISVPFLVVPMIANALVRCVGDAFWPSLMMIGSALVNIIATPILIFGWGVIPAFDIEGAAFGTLFAQVLTLFASLAILIIREKLLSFSLPSKEQLVESWRYLLSIAVPASVGNMINPLSIAIVTAIIAWFGEKSVAAFGLATRVEFFAVIPMLALSSAIGPLAGQSWGAGQVHRITEGLKISYWVCIAWAVLLSIFLWFVGPYIISGFTDDNEVSQLALIYLRIIPMSVWGYGIVIIAAAAFNSVGKAKVGLGYYVLRSALFYVPLSWLGALFAQVDYVFVCIALANVISGVLVAWYSLRYLKKLKQTPH